MRIHTDIESIEGIEKPVLTIGTFDGVHKGHKVIIDRLNEIADREGGESVLLTFHPHPRTVVRDSSHIELLTTMEERLELLREAGLQNVIVHPFTREFSRISALAFVRDLLVNKIGVHFAVVGHDHHFGRNREGDIHLLHELADVYDFKVEEISAQTIQEVEVSSTKIRKALREGRIEKAKSFLGYDYKVTGTVVAGDGRGKDLGYPTANLLPDDMDKLVPGKGVYAVNVLVEGAGLFQGMLNIGTRPTFSEDVSDVKIEAHLFEMNDDLYGKRVQVEFISRIRSEKKFESVKALIGQLDKDKISALEILEGH